MAQLFADAPRGLGRMMAGGGGKTPRAAFDFYPTPADVTAALLASDGHLLRGYCEPTPGGPLVWEPCAGDGAMADVLEAHGFLVVSSDIHPRRAGMLARDVRHGPSLGRCVVTNPPFALAGAIAAHLLLERRVTYLPLLLKGVFWHAAERLGLWRDCPPSAIYPLTWRPDFQRLGNPTMECAWVVWWGGVHRRMVLPCVFRPLPRPACDAAGRPVESLL